MSLEGSEAPRTARVSFLAYATQPVGRKIIAQCVSTGRRTVSPQPRNGADELTRRPILSPRSGADNAARLLPTAVRPGVAACAPRAVGAGRSNGRGHPFFAPGPGAIPPPACCPRLCALGYYLAPFGLSVRPVCGLT